MEICDICQETEQIIEGQSYNIYWNGHQYFVSLCKYHKKGLDKEIDALITKWFRKIYD